MPTIDDRIKAIMAEAQRKAEQLRAKEEQIHARKLEALIKRDRATETRRKILLGALVTVMMEEDEKAKSIMMTRLDGFLTKAADRELFGLAVQKKNASQAAEDGLAE